MNSSIPVYYIASHSEIPRKENVSHAHIPEIPENTYLIMTTKCGRLAAVSEENAFLKKWINSPEGIERLKKLINAGNHPLYVNGRRVFFPGNKGPINQVLDFINENKPEIFFLGVKKAPIQMRNLAADYAKKIKEISRENLLKVYKKLTKTENKNLNHLNDFDEADLVAEIQSTIAKLLINNEFAQMAYPQLYMAITDNAYFKEFVIAKTIPFEHIVFGTSKISKILAKHGPGIYIINACRGYRRINRGKLLVEIKPDETKILNKSVFLQRGWFESDLKYLLEIGRITPAQKLHVEERLANWERTVKPLRRNEKDPKKKINKRNPKRLKTSPVNKVI